MHASLELTDFRGGDGPHFILVPGILAHAHLHLVPLKPIFEPFNSPTISVGSYEGENFDAHHSVDKIVASIERNLTIGQRTILFASSLGGMLTALALTKLRESYSVDELNALISTIIVDAPRGGADLVIGPKGLNTRAAWMTSHFKPSKRANSGYGRRILKLFRSAPKNDEIDEGLDKKQVKAEVIEGLSGHSFTVWYDQVQWMLNTELDLEKLDGLDITYIACVKNNVTVHQPQALEEWRPHVKKLIEIDTPHCAYIQAQPTYNRTLTPLLGGLLSEHIA